MADAFTQPAPEFFPTLPREPEQEGFLESGGLDAAFRLENDVVNAIAYSKNRIVPRDPNFDVIERGKQSALWGAFSPQLARAQSEKEFDMIERKIIQEQKDRQLLASHGLKGFAAGMAAGVLSPTILIPLIGPARGARGVGQAFGLAALAATAAEVPLLAQQETRTSGEAFAGIAAGTVLGGLLGSASVMLRSRADFNRIAQDLSPDADLTPRAAIYRSGDGSIVRIGEDVPLQMPPGNPVNPRAGVRIAALDRAAAQVRETLAAEGVEGVRTIARAEGATPELKELVSGIDRLTAVGRATERAAIAAGGSEQVAKALRKVVDAGPIAADATPAQRAAATRRQNALTRELEKAGYTDEASRETFLSQVEQQREGVEIPTPEAALWQVLEEKAEPLVARETPDPSPEASIGARARGEQFVPTIEEINPDGSVTVTPITELTDAGEMSDAFLIGRIAQWTSPVLRSINQFDMPRIALEDGTRLVSRVARRRMSQLSDSGVEFEGNQFGLVAGPEGTVEARQQYYQALLSRAYEIQLKAYNKYLLGTENPTGTDRIAQIVRRETNKAPQGKLTWQEFKAEMSDALNLGDQSEISEVASAAKELRREFFVPINQAAQEAADMHGAKRLYREIEETPDKSYMTHQFAPDKIGRDRLGFTDMVKQHYNDVMTAHYNRRIARELEGLEADAAYADALLLDKEAATEALETTEDAIRNLEKTAVVDPRLDSAKAMRDEARDMLQTEFERKLAGLSETMQTDPEMRGGLWRQAKAEVKDEVERLKAEAASLEAAVARDRPTDIDTKKQLKILRSRKRAINRSFGRLEPKREALFNRIEQNEEANLNALGRVQRATQRWLRDSARIADDKLDAEFAKLMEQIDRDMGLIERGEARLQKLEAQADIEPSEKLGLERSRQMAREARAAKRAGRADEALFFNRDAARAQLRETLDEATAAVNRVNNKRAERNAIMRQQAEVADPVRAREEVGALRERREARIEALEDELQQAGATDINVRASRFNFEETAADMATQLANKITGHSARIGQLDIMPEIRGPLKARVLDIPYEKKKAYLENDSEPLLARYVRTMGADIELYRATGSRSGHKILQELEEEMEKIDRFIRTRETDANGKPITQRQRDKQVQQLQKAWNRRKQEFNGVLERIRGLRGLPDDPTSFGYRLGRGFMNMNVATMMGSAAITSIPDAGRSVMAMGLSRTFGDSWKPLVQGLVDEGQKGINAKLIRELRLVGVGLETFTGQRARGGLDLEEFRVGRTRFEQGLEYLAHKTPQVALFGQWTDTMKTMTGLASMARILRTVQSVADGSLDPDDLRILARTGINPEMAGRITAQLRESGTPYKDIFIPNTESWTDYGALRAFHAAMSAEDARMVVTPGLERPLWMDGSIIGRMVGQFRSFTMAANTKMLIAGLQTRDMAAFHTLQGVMFSLALGTVSYYTWAMTTGPRAREEMLNASWETWMDQAMYRSGLLGAFGEAQSIASAVPGLAPYTTLQGSELAGRRAGNLMGKALGPSFGKARDIERFLLGIDDPTQSTVAQARKLLPYQNVFYLRSVLNMVEEGVGEGLGLPEDRR